MSTIVLRSVKGTPLTNTEVDTNFSNLNTDKLEASTTATLTNKTINLTSNTLVATSAQLRAAVTDETGTGALVFATSPTLVTPALGTPSSGVVTNLTGTASININGTVGATTPNTGNFTVLTENSSPVVVQTDIGTAPNEIPLNQYLGNLAYQDAANIAGPVRVGGTLTAVGATTLATTSMTSATVTGAIDAGGGIVAEQLVVDNFTASSSAVLRGGATNLLTYSEQFDNAAWPKTEATITTDTIVAPDGTAFGDKLVANTVNGVHLVAVPINVTSGTAYTFSFYAKAGEYQFAGLLFAAAGFGTNTVDVFNLSTGAVSTNASGTASIVSVGNGWYRCSATRTASATAASTFQIRASSDSVGSSFAGNGYSGIFIWGAQLNTGSVPAAYLKTVATAVSTAYAAPIESPNGLAFPLLATMTPARNADMTFELASNTSLVVKVRGSDGTVRSVTLTLA